MRILLCMSNIAVGLIALVAGALLCFLGRTAVRVILSIWGAFVGFTLGAAIVAAITGTSSFATVVGWLVGVLLAFLFAGLAYAFYAVAVVVTLGSIGYGLGAALAVALGAGPTVAYIVAITAAVLLAVAALATNFPEVLLIALTASFGAGVMVAGLMLVAGVAVTADFTVADIRSLITQQRWWWIVLDAVLVVLGILVQARSPRGTAMRTRWAG